MIYEENMTNKFVGTTKKVYLCTAFPRNRCHEELLDMLRW
jgi:hypothetical protein